jgi:4-amino-4-deoxy-L-arabinose transferase-like glycosyltransferase
MAALALRLFFFLNFPAVTDDSRIYANLASNWMQQGVYGQTQGGQPEKQIVPADTRLPGYPAFLAGMFWLFGAGNFKAVMLTQILIDLATCLIVADLARRTISERAARIAFVLAALCPFLANYAAAALTETLEIFFTALALDCAAAALNRMHAARAEVWAEDRAEPGALDQTYRHLWTATGAAIAACILLRPDGGILLATVALYLAVLAWRHRAGRKEMADILVAGIIVVAIALAPLVPWTIRNFRTLHHFQPLAPRYANETNELVSRGFNRWVKTWIADYASVEEIYWNVPGDKIDPEKLPSRAIDGPTENNPAQRGETLAVIADYNLSQEMTPELDARFGNLAATRIRAHPVRYYVGLPVLRVADMWLRPRTEILPPDVRWWEFNDDRKQSVLAVGFGLLNLAYLAAALLALILGQARGQARTKSEIRWAGLLGSFLLLRSAFLGTLENPEPRYTLECYPAIIVLASSLLCRSKFAGGEPGVPARQDGRDARRSTI